MKIVWDERKRLANLDKHGMDFADLPIGFFETATLYPARGERLIAVGSLVGMSIIVVIFARLGSEAISVISMRPVGAKERKLK